MGSTTHTALAALLATSLLACGGSDDLTHPPQVTSCDQRLTELVDGSCEAVSVLGISSHDITFEQGGVTLHGTLTLPETAGDYQAPGVVLMHGSGPVGRDGSLEAVLGVAFDQPVAVHRDLAEQLAWRGVASLRYDKRICFVENNPDCAQSVGDYPISLLLLRVDDFVEDARAAAHTLALHPAVRDHDVVVMGHSQGGNFVPRLVRDEPIITGGVGLAAPSLSLIHTLVGQLQGYVDHLTALDPQQHAALIGQYQAIADQYAADVPAVLDGSYPESSYGGAPLGFWQSWAALMEETEQDVMSTEEPLLYLSGDWDFNVWPEHLDRYASWGAASPGQVDTQLLPDMTHAFVPITVTPPEVIPAATGVDPRFSPQALDIITQWLVDTDPAAP